VDNAEDDDDIYENDSNNEYFNDWWGVRSLL
jgi:hypothetical protein